MESYTVSIGGRFASSDRPDDMDTDLVLDGPQVTTVDSLIQLYQPDTDYRKRTEELERSAAHTKEHLEKATSAVRASLILEKALQEDLAKINSEIATHENKLYIDPHPDRAHRFVQAALSALEFDAAIVSNNSMAGEHLLEEWRNTVMDFTKEERHYVNSQLDGPIDDYYVNKVARESEDEGKYI